MNVLIGYQNLKMIYVLFSEREETYSYKDQNFWLFSTYWKAKKKLNAMWKEFLKNNQIKDEKNIEEDDEDSKAYEDKYCRYYLYIVKRDLDDA